FGLPINVADGMLSEKIREVENKILLTNLNRDTDIAALLDIPYMCVHTPADNAATTFLQRLMDKEKPERLGDIISLLKTIPEYKEALKRHSGPKILAGVAERRAGKIFVDLNGGAEGPAQIYEKLAQVGIGTVVSICVPEEHRKEAEKNHISIIAAGSTASDSLGLNLVLDRILKDTGIEVIECSGFRRFCHE
ncbi:MAG TPA: NGG1p interacting factor NIF3, partial [Candidatus Wallbacteria bacterium]|nr:NGG1p interacting factor NIF3 [Candidatus Wallbacteria bacterium]